MSVDIHFPLHNVNIPIPSSAIYTLLSTHSDEQNNDTCGCINYYQNNDTCGCYDAIHILKSE